MQTGFSGPRRFGANGRSWLLTGLIAAAAILLVTVMLAYAGLVIVSTWRGDDYGMVPRYRSGGFSFYLHRVLGWSPRPVSELIILLFAKAMIVGRQSATTAFIALMWVVYAGATLFAVRQSFRDSVTALLVTPTIIIFPLLMSAPGEVFYWPLGAFAYVPTLAGIAFCVLTSLGPARPDPVSVPGSLALVVIAGSSEVGAMFALSFSSVWLAVLAGEFIRLRMVRLRDQGLIAAPFLASLAIMYMSVTGRVGKDVEAGGQGHLLVRSLIGALASVKAEIIGSAPNITPRVLVYVFLFIGWSVCLAHQRVATWPARRLWVLAASLVMTILGSAFAGWYQFATDCCERHTTCRELMFLLLLLVASCIFTVLSRSALARAPLFLAPLAVMVCVVIAGASRAPDVITEYAHLPSKLTLMRQNEASGRSAGTAMTFHLLPYASLTGEIPLHLGEYANSPDAPWDVRAVLSYYDKRTVEVCSTQCP